MSDFLPRIILLLVLFSASFYFSSSEIAFSSLNRIKLKVMIENNVKGAKKIENVTSDINKFLSTVLIGNNIANILIPVVSTSIAIDAGGNNAPAIAVSTVIITIVVMMCCEIIPKALAIHNPEKLSLAYAPVMEVFMFIFKPIVFVSNTISKAAVKVLGGNTEKMSTFMTEAELKSLISVSQEEGILEEHEGDLVRSALDFDETTVEKILTHRVDMTAVSVTESVEKIRDLFLEEGYSRLPVYDKTPDKVIGIISNKEFMKRILASPDTFQLSDIMQDITKLPSLMKLSDALKIMQKSKSHLAVVLDQYGGTEGIVALEDILEELVGEIWDENDEEVQPIKFTGETTFEVGSELSIIDFNRAFEVYNKVENIHIDSECNTVGGWVFELFGKIPDVGEQIASEQFKITVLNMEGRRIGRLKFEIS